MFNGNPFFDFLVGILRGLDPSKKMRLVRTIHFHPFSRRELRHASENWLFRCWNEVRKCGFVSENEGSDLGNEGSDLGMPWPNGPPSSDCPVVWHTDVAPQRHQVRDRSSPQTRECVSPCPQGLLPPQNTRPRVVLQPKLLYLVRI